ncbi:MAG: nucleoside kinase [Clostridiales bacterium]|nr:nucleoside kinase [Clostridiales bacterium]
MAYDFTIKTFTEERAYHNTAIMVYLKAVKAVLGEVDVTIGNSLNQGYYSYINKDGARLTTSDIHKIRDTMKKFVDQDLELVIENDNVAHAMMKWNSLGYHEKARLLEGRPEDETVEIANLRNYRNCMYTVLLPSAGYINLFDLRPYRNGLLLRLPNALHGQSIPPYRDDDKLYEAYAECRRMRKYTGIEYLADMNEAIRNGKADEIIRESEWMQSRQLEEFATKIVEEHRKVVLIAGPSSSGKTTTAKRLCLEISRLTNEDPLYLGTDDYFVERGMTPLGPDGEPDFEGLGAVDLPLFNRQMEDLLAGKEVDMPEFDFINGTKVFGKRITKLKENQIMVIEGIHSLNDIMTQNIPRSDKFKIYISPLTQIAVDRHNRLSTADARLLRRMVRDNQFRGYNAEATLKAWPKVRAGESVNVFPYSSSADVVFNSSTVYETNLLKTYAEPLLTGIGESSEQYAEVQRILSFMKYFDKIESDEAVPDNSILREFIGPRK